VTRRRCIDRFTEVRNLEKLVGRTGLRPLPWHFLLRHKLANGTATPEERAAAVDSRRY